MPFDLDLILEYRELSTPLIGDTMGRNGGMLGLRPYHGTVRLVGPAFTVKTRPGDNLHIHVALDQAEPGDVLVIDGGGVTERALVGELMCSYAASRGLAGVVVCGAVRDIAYFRESKFPCFACGNTHRGPFRDGPGKVQVPVSVGGEVVNPGDLIVGDEDGVLVISADRAADLLPNVQALAAKEERDKDAIREGKWDRAWVRAAVGE
jgi:RraA family protein